MGSRDSERVVHVIGHKNPDTDSICSALVYAWMKNQDGTGRYEAFRAGALNRETEFVLRFFGVEPPPLCTDVSPQVRDITIRRQPGIGPETSVRSAWRTMRDVEVDTLCVVDEDQRVLGVVAVKDIANANMDLLDANILAEADTRYGNLLSTIEGELLTGDLEEKVRGRICIATSLKAMEGAVHPGDLVLLTQEDVQRKAIEDGAACLVVCRNCAVSQEIVDFARSRGCAVMVTHYDTYAAARLVSTAAPVRHLMKSANILQFAVDTPLDEVQKVMTSVRFRYFPILDKRGRYFGLISRRNLLNLQRKQVILVDHNERTQAIDGIEEAEVLEIIDHHRIGAVETNEPVFFHNAPVGCTSTILYQMLKSRGMTPPGKIAGLLLSAILSDTLMFRSPTCTPEDEAAARALAKLAGLEIEDYAEQMFEAGGDLTGRTAEDLFHSDFKIFQFGKRYIGVGQACVMTRRACAAAEELVRPYLPRALEEHRISTVLFMVTDTPRESTELLYCGDEAEEILGAAFGVEPRAGAVTLPGVVSRKKQLIPPLRAALQQER